MALPARKTKTTTSRSQNGDSANTGAEAAGFDQSAETLRIPRRPRYSSRQIYEMTKAQLQAIDADVELRQEEGPVYSEDQEPTSRRSRKKPRRCKLTPRQVYEMAKAQLEALDADLEFRDDDDDPPSFDIGRRPIYRRDEFGEVELDYVPLTRADALHPREGDEFAATQWHNFVLALLMEIARSKLDHDPSFWWLMDGDLDLGLIGCRSIRPDLAFLLGVTRQRDRHSGKFYLEKETNADFRRLLAIEVTSESTRQNDLVHKKCLYADAGFEQYVIVDSRPPTKTKPRHIVLQDCRMAPHVVMEALPQRPSGRIPLLALGVWLGVVDDEIAVYENERGKRIHDYPGMVRAWEQARQRAERAKQRAKRVKQQLDQANQKIDQANQKIDLANNRTDEADREARAAREQAAELDKRLQAAQEELRRLRGESSSS